MKLYKRGFKSCTYNELHMLYSNKISRSRTESNGVKVIKLSTYYKYGMGGCTLKKDGSNYVVQLYGHDLISYGSDGFVTILSLPTYHTPCARIGRMLGVAVYRTDAVGYLSQNPVRALTEATRDGTAAHWIRRSVPLFAGVRIHEQTAEIHPDDVAKLPSDRRKHYVVPTKEAKKEFKEKWKPVADLGALAITMTLDVEGFAKDGRIPYYSDEYQRPHKAMVVEKLVGSVPGEVSIEDVEGGMLFNAGGYILYSKRTPEFVRSRLAKGLKRMAKETLARYATLTGKTETKGGQLLHKGWYVSQSDMEEK